MNRRFLLKCLALLASVHADAVFAGDKALSRDERPQARENAIPVGEGQFRILVARGPVNVFTYRPVSFTANSPIWIVIHGARRNVAEHSAFDYYDVWEPLAKRAGALLLVPEFVERE